MKRTPLPIWVAVLAFAALLIPYGVQAAAKPPAPPKDSIKVPPTRYYPLTVGNKWAYGFNRKTAFSLVPTTGDNQDFNITTTGTQTVEITKEDGERSGDKGKVYVQRATEVADSVGGAPGGDSATSKEPRIVGELYFRSNDRGIWVVADGEPNDKGDDIEKVTDRSIPMLWVPADLTPEKSWIVNCQIDTTVSARIVAHAGKAQSLKVNGVTYENCIPVVSLADNLSGKLDLGIAMAPISGGRIVDLTWYAPGIGVVRSHQLANFELEPPNPNYSSATAHFEETQELQSGYKAQ